MIADIDRLAEAFVAWRKTIDDRIEMMGIACEPVTATSQAHGSISAFWQMQHKGGW